LPHKPFILFLDENICNCQPLLESLNHAGIQYERLLARFAAGTPDSDWLPVVGKNEWVLLTVDQNIRYNELERLQVIKHGVREFVLTSGNLSGPEMAGVVTSALARMKRLCARQPAPFIATISKSGAVVLKYDRGGSAKMRR
jgi:hypothetical protein